MKRLVCITGLLLIGCVLIGAVFAPSTGAEADTEIYSAQPSSDEAAEEIYVLKIDDGYLNVYIKGETEPYIKTGTLASSLPQSDVSVLKKGLEVKGRDGLRRALEDYCS